MLHPLVEDMGKMAQQFHARQRHSAKYLELSRTVSELFDEQDIVVLTHQYGLTVWTRVPEQNSEMAGTEEPPHPR